MNSTTWQTSRLMFIGAVLLAVLVLPAVAQEVPSILISRLKGAVEVNHAADTDGSWVSATTGQEIGAGWQLRTGKGGKAQLVFPRDNVVILKENSVLYIDKLDLGGGAKLNAAAGDLLVDLKNALAPGSDFELETPTALAVVRGTSYGAEGISGEGVTFYGYSGEVAVFDVDLLFDPVILLAGYAVDVPAGEAPSEPYPSGDAGTRFAEDAGDTTGFEALEGALAPVVADLGHLLLRVGDLAEQLGQAEDEWRRYEHSDSTGHLLVLYAQILALGDSVSLTADRFGGLTMGNADLTALLGEHTVDLDPAQDNLDPDDFDGRAQAYLDYTEALADRFADGAGPFDIGDLLAEIASQFAGIYERLQLIAEDAEPLIDDNEDLLDQLRGTIPPGDPVLGIRWGTIDTDNDGVSDVDEAGLGTDPASSNEVSGFIELLAPDTGDTADYPETESVTFEFEPLDSDMIIGYDLLIESGGQQWLRRDISAAEEVDLVLLVGPGGPYNDELFATGEVTLAWQVIGILDEQSLVSRVTTPPVPGSASRSNITSEQRDITIAAPQLAETAILSLEPVGAVLVKPGETILVRGTLTEALNLGQWELTIVYDPSVVEFNTGHRLGLFSATTLFFGDHLGGVLTISGSDSRAGAGISGSGDIFELEFTATESGSCTIELSEVLLHDADGNELPAEIGDGVDIDIN